MVNRSCPAPSVRRVSNSESGTIEPAPLFVLKDEFARYVRVPFFSLNGRRSMMCTGRLLFRQEYGQARPERSLQRHAATRPDNLLGRNSGERRFRPINREDVTSPDPPRQVVVYIDDTGLSWTRTARRTSLAIGKLPAIVGPVNLRHQHRLDGRTRRHFNDLDIRAILARRSFE
jgi:hypothetical protein